jgi:hypothetical protein
MTPRARLLAIASLVALVATACGTRAGTSDAGTSTASPASAAPGASDGPTDRAPVVAEVLDFEAPLLAGGTLRGETLAGRDVAFWFWAPW